MAIIDKRFLYYTTEAGFLKDKNDGKIDSKSVVFLSENGKRAIYTHGKFFNPEAFVVGTQSSSTNAFTGVFNEIDSLYDGLNIRYWLPYNGTSSAATLNLTIGDTTTGAIPVYIKGTTRFTNHIGGTNVLDLTYRENVGGIEKGWWVLGSYGDAADGNTTYTFTPGTDGSFKVKPSNGSEQTISIGKPGTAGTADKVEKSFVVQINSGEEEYVSKYTFDGSTAKTINISQGSNISFGVEDGELTINGNYEDATITDSGLMSSDDKTKLDYTNIAYGTCSTAAATAAKEITISGNSKWSLTAGSVIVIKFSYTNSASNPTFNVNGTGAKSVWYNTALITTGSLGMAGTANRPMQFMYDGTRFVFVGWSYDTNSTYSTYSLGIGYGTCATAADTVAKVVTLSNYTLVTGGIVSVKFNNNVPASATMNINSKGAKAIYHRGAAIAAGVIKAGDIATFIYSTNYHLIAIDRATSKATQSVDGLMSSEDKTKLDGIATGATANKGTVTSVTIKNGDGIEVDSTAAITTVGERTISLSESGVTVNTDGSAKTYGNTSQQSPSHSDTFNIPYFTVDKYGRITAASTTTVKLPASGNTDEKVKQSSSTSNLDLPLLVGTTETPTSGTAYGAYYNTGVTMNPSTKTITATTFSGALSGNATSATKLKTAQTIDGVKFDGSSNISHYSTCSTADNTAAKTVDLDGFELVTGSRIAIKFTVTNTAANPTLNVNSTGAKAIMYRGSAISAGYLAANRVYEFIYDGTDYELIGDVNTNTTYSGDRGISLVSGKFGHSNTAITEKTAFVDTDASISVSSNDGSFKVTDIKYDAYGHITGSQDRTITLSEPHKGTVTSVTIEGGTGISVDNSNAITSNGTRTISLDMATTSEIGGMMASNALTTEVTLTSGNGTTANRYYGVQVDKNGKAFVNIPWTDGNTYTSAYSSTAAGTAAKTASCTNYTLKSNSWLHVTIVNSNTSQGAITLNVNSKGAKPIHINGTASSSSNYTLPAGTYLVYYDGTAYQFNTNGILPGTSSKASTLATSRTLTIGSTGKDFNGSANVSWTLAEIGAAASSHKHAYTDLTGSGTIANQAIVSSGTTDGWNLYTLGSAAEKTASTSISSNSTDNQVPTAKAVYTAITTGIKANDAMIFKGTLGTGGTVTALPASHKIGDTYRVITAGSYAGVQCEVGDLVICITAGTAANNAHWTVAQTNIDGAVVGPTSSTDGCVALFSGTSGKVLKQSPYTLGCSVPADAKFTDTTYTLSDFEITATATELNYCDGVTSNIQTQLNGKAATNHNHDSVYLKLSGGTISSSSYGPLIIKRSGSNNMAAIKFENDLGALGSIGMNAIDGNLIRYNAATNANYNILDSSNSSVSLSGNTLTVKINGTSYSLTNTNTTYDIGDYDTSGLIKPWKSYTKDSTGPTAATSNTAVAVNTISTTSGRYYAVEMDSAGRAFVNVPWVDNDTDTKNTAGAEEKTNTKLFLVGRDAQSTGTSYSNSKVYIGTDNCLYSNGSKVSVSGHTHSYVPLAGGTMTGDLTFNYSTSGGAQIIFKNGRITEGGGGWADKVLNLQNSSGTSIGTGYGIHGNGNVLSYIYLGHSSDYTGNNFRIYSDKITFGDNTVLHSGNYSTWAATKDHNHDSVYAAISHTHYYAGSSTVGGAATSADKLNTNAGSDTKPVYFSGGIPKECSTYAGGTAVTLNGASKAASTASFYAPTGVGTEGQVLVSTASAPEWKDFDEVGLVTSSDVATISQTITTSWAPLVTAANMAKYCPEAGTYVIQVSGSGIGVCSGIFSWNTSGSTQDEILLHRTGASSSNIYLRLSSRVLQIAGSAAITTAFTITVKVKRLI